MSISNFLFSYFLKKTDTKVLIAYGSQTGNVEEVSKALFKKIKFHYKELKEMNSITDINDLNNYDYVFFLVSTTGDGEFPDNSYKFWKLIKKYREPVNFNYALIGFGDSNYRSFCHTSKCLSRVLKKLQAEEIFPLTKIDDATDNCEKIDKWIEDICLLLDNKENV